MEAITSPTYGAGYQQPVPQHNMAPVLPSGGYDPLDVNSHLNQLNPVI